MEGKRKVKEKKTHDVPWRLVNPHQNHGKQQVQAELILPSVVHKRYTGEWDHPLVRLDLHPKIGTTHALTIMRNSTGSNILHASLVTEGQSGVLAWVEPSCGNLEYYLRSTRLGIPRHRSPQSKHVLPSPNLRSAVGGIFNGMYQLILSGLYHGNFSLINTYYTIDEQDPDTVEVKLCNFKKKTGSYKKKLSEDWKAILAALKLIREIANTLNQVYLSLDCCQLDGLINIMGRINPSNSELAFEEVRLQPFFWGKVERTLFFINDIPLALAKKQFISGLRNAKFIVLPWNNTKLTILLDAMDKYRKSKKKKPYDIYCRVAFVKFLSGLYTHESELELTETVDEVIEDQCPDLCYNLYVCLPGAKS